MNSNSEIPQQINDVDDLASSDRSGLSMNGSGTDSKSDTPLTRDRSRFGLTGLRSLRDKYGPHSAIGHRVSNIEEMFGNLPAAPEGRIDYLMPDSERVRYETIMKSIRKQTAELAQLLAA